jgi:HPt (histidine-containing phosphotransfer) domain-containing protein
MDRLGGDTELLREVIKLFLEDCPLRVRAIKAAVDQRDGNLLRTAAHSLKGAAANLAAPALFDAARTLEQLGTEGQLDPAAAAWQVLSTEATALMDVFRAMEGAQT